jgi:prepilin-type processing-associated H-X9-DG protein
LALHNHHDVYQRFPPGGARNQAPFGQLSADNTPLNWGNSWLVYILPYVEQKVIYDKWQFVADSGHINATDMGLINGVVIPVYACPSSPLPTQWADQQYADTKRMGVHYVGVSGAVDTLIPNFTESRYNTFGGAGIIGGGGVLIPNGKLRFADITDGSSNVMVVSEHGNHMYSADGSRKDWRGGQPWGWTIGVQFGGVPPNAGTGLERAFNLVTIRYRINQNKGWSNGNGDCSQGVCYDSGANTPINSAHPGGVNTLLGDGSVRFLGDTLPIDLLARLATRDDGQPLGTF